MSSLKIDKIQGILNDELLLETLKAIFNEAVENYKPATSATIPDEILGQQYRAYLEAKLLLNQCFTTLEGYKKDANTNKPFNKEK